MNKPTVFFSHSSKDAQPLARLKELFAAGTGGSIETFLSSDGQSIPLGRNWVHRIEEALKSSRLMFVFVTENSLRSNWIFFESGFAYSKGIRVIPVGFLRTDLRQLAPPLSLLQGFNIDSEEGLNNIIAVVNEEFSHSHKSFFTHQNYVEIIGASPEGAISPFGDFGGAIRDLLVTITRRGPVSATPRDISKRTSEGKSELRGILEAEGVSCQESGESFELPGATITIQYGMVTTWTIRIDPGTALVNLRIAERLSKTLGLVESTTKQITCLFSSSVQLETRFHVVSGKLNGVAVLRPNRYFRIGELDFGVTRQVHFTGAGLEHGAVSLIVDPSSEIISVDQIRDLISMLFQKGILHFDAGLEDA